MGRPRRTFSIPLFLKLELCYGWNVVAPLDPLGTSYLGLLVDYLKSAYTVANLATAPLCRTVGTKYYIFWLPVMERYMLKCEAQGTKT